ncbi:MAG TPA: TolC family protein [Gemmataceae bacterium]|nr:TolC family protein [Gemmataceae bacterium]
MRTVFVTLVGGLLCLAAVVPVAPAQQPVATPYSGPPPKPTAARPELTLTDLESMALRGNPTLAQAAANVEAARGRALQAGLYPNPTVGYIGDQIGLRGKAAPGELQGVFVDQTIVTAGKLKLNRAMFGAQASQMEAQALAQQYRVVNGVRTRYYQLLAMQRLLDVRADLVKVADEAVTTTEELVNVGAANKPDLLQARIEARRERVGLENARTTYAAARKQLAAFVGNPDLTAARVEGDLEAVPTLPDYEATLARLLEGSPEAMTARAEVDRAQVALRREQVEPIPNVNVRIASGYNSTEEARRVTYGVQVGVRLPVFDRNQGNIHAAQAQAALATAEVGRVELSLRDRLAREYARHRTAQTLADAYRKQSLPEAKEAYELYLDSFRKRRAAWPQVLVAQRMYFQINEEYVDALDRLRRAEVAILGYLLVDGLDQPPGPGAEGRRAEPEGVDRLPDPIGGEGRSIRERLGSRPGGD